MAGHSTDEVQNDLLLEKPPSPVLNSKTNRRYLQSRRMQRRSRVKLTDRFSEGTSQHPASLNDTCNSFDTLLSTPSPAAELEKMNEKVGTEPQRQNYLCFKKFESPAVLSKSVECFSQNECSGFKTARGILVNLSDGQIQQSKKLFADILGESNPGTSRSNKHAFLSKKKSDNFKTHQATIFEETLDVQSLNNKNYNELNSVINQPSLGFKTASGKGVHISETAYKVACKRFNDDTSYSGLKCLPNSEKRTDEERGEISILSTQETNELFSDFTILENNHKAAVVQNEDDNCFKGFSPEEIAQSRQLSSELISCTLKLSKTIKKFCKCNQNRVLRMKSKPHENNIYNAGTVGNKFVLDFSKASGKIIHMNESALKSAKNKFREEFGTDNILPDTVFTDFKKPQTKETQKEDSDKFFQANLEEHFKGFHEESIKESQNIAEAFIMSLQKFNDPELTIVPRCKTEFPFCQSYNKTLTPLSTNGFTTAAGNKVTVSESALKKAKNIWASGDTDYDFTVKKLISISKDSVNENSEPSGFQTAAGKSMAVSKEALNRERRIFQNLDNEISLNNFARSGGNSCSGFQTAAGNTVRFSEDALNKAKQFFQNIDSELSFPKRGSLQDKTSFQSRTGTFLKSSDTISKRENLDSALELNNSAKSATNSEVSFLDDGHTLTSDSSVVRSTTLRRRKRLGVSSCKQISIPTHKMEEALRRFEDESSIMSPARNNQPVIYNSTPLRNIPLPHIESDLTPIKTVCKPVQHTIESKEYLNDRILTHERTKGTINSWNTVLETEKKALQTKIKTLEERQEALHLQKILSEETPHEHQKKRTGILFDEKQRKPRISLKDFMKIDTSSRGELDVTPQNAELVHFNCTEPFLPYIRTSDGACVIPNINNHVGLSEIEASFKVMPGVNTKLIPSGWIQNHFKWIVWKLASYENFFPNINNCLTVENVMQQLKYRYDREIDRAERPTLRKILEMDDAPQKRMVLCVSDIFNLQNGQFELELTDGWYSIRTIVDEPICRQISKQKILLGTKLITFGAELLNCEGCHPLQATDNIRLKINCNSTRRARWYAKLGYQKCPEPFPVKLSSVFPSGGLIGRIRFYVARVYPVKYMEKQNKLTVWRNRKAEELRAQEWENKGRQDMEKLRETITRDYEMSMRTAKQNVTAHFTLDQIKNITCPEILFNLYQNNKDPEKFQEILSSSQMRSLLEYQQRLISRQQGDISRKLEDSLGKLQIPKRDVTPVLQVLVVDILDPNEKSCIFHIWRPSEEHIQVLKESLVFEAFNVLPKKNGDLCSMSRTRFQTYSKELPNFQKYKRVLYSISQIISTTLKPPFNEFDTVGVVVSMSIDGCSQNLWLTDECGRLLYIKIFEGSKNCLLLDNLKIGQLVAASNLLFCISKLEFAEAIANHLTVISCYPKAKHLEDGIDILKKQLPKDIDLLLAQCQQKISYHINKIDITRDYKNTSSTSLVASNSLAASDVFDDSSDVLFSMIDVDKVT